MRLIFERYHNRCGVASIVHGTDAGNLTIAVVIDIDILAAQLRQRDALAVNLALRQILALSFQTAATARINLIAEINHVTLDFLTLAIVRAKISLAITNQFHSCSPFHYAVFAAVSFSAALSVDSARSASITLE